MISINQWSILWTVVNLLILYAIFKKFLYKPVMNVIEEREKTIKKQFEEANNEKEEASKIKALYEEELENARNQADDIIKEARSRAKEEHDLAVLNTKAETEKMKEKAKADIANEKEKATIEAQGEIARLALVAAKKIMETGDSYDTADN